VARTLLGDSERDQLILVLREHYAAGRLTLEELDRRAGVVYGSAYRDEAEAALTGLPAVPGIGPEAASAPRLGRQDGPAGRWPRRRGHAQVTEPEPGWVRTDERFRDPSSGQIMRVWIDPADASRHYAPDS
jgi:Domain of unknown function (DUF1707)